MAADTDTWLLLYLALPCPFADKIVSILLLLLLLVVVVFFFFQPPRRIAKRSAAQIKPDDMNPCKQPLRQRYLMTRSTPSN